MRVLLSPSTTPIRRPPTVFIDNGFGGVRHGFNSRPNQAIELSINPLPMGHDLPAGSHSTSYPSGLTSDSSPRSIPAEHIAPLQLLPLSRNAENRNDSTDSATMDLCNPIPTHSHVPILFGDSASSDIFLNGTPAGLWQSIETQDTQKPDTEEVYSIGSPYSRVAIQDLLNPLTSKQAISQDEQNEKAASPQVGPSNTNRTQPLSPSSISSFCTCTTTASRNTIQLSNSIEEHAYLLNTLYYTCVDATLSYITSLPPLNPRRRRHDTTRYHPYLRANSTHSQNSAATINSQSPTLMDNISTISTYLWKKACSDPMAPHREEADAVAVMGDLYLWGEIIARGMEGWDDVVDEELDVIAGLEGPQRDRAIAMRVGRAAKSLCEWVRDGDAWEICEEVMEDLGSLEESRGGE